MSYPRLRACVTIPVTICMITWTSTPLRSGACRPMTFVEREARDRAPACGLNPRLEIASSTRSRVSCEIERLPLITYETVEIDTPAA